MWVVMTVDTIITCTCIMVIRTFSYTRHNISGKYLSHWRLLFHVHISSLHRYCYTWYYYFLFMSYWYIDTLFHWILWFHIFVPSLHGYSIHSFIMFIHHCNMDSLVYMRWLFLYSCCMDHFSWITIHITWIFLNPVTWLFPVTDIDTLLLDISVVGMRCVKLSATWI